MAMRLCRRRVSGIVTVLPLTLVTGQGENEDEDLGEWQDFHGMKKELCMFLHSHPLMYLLLEDFNIKDPEF